MIWDLILTDQRNINTITKSLINAPENSYIFAPKESSNNDVRNILYIPHGTSQNSLPPILISVTEKLDDSTLITITLYCVDIYEYYNSPPICLIISQQKVKEDIVNNSPPCQELSFLREIQCTFWAEKCLLLSEEDINKNEMKNHP